METQLRALARFAFRYKVLSSQGQAYEDLFVDVIQHKNRRFRPVKPQGKIGDRKNDGFDPEKGRYYQVFAPEDLRKHPSDAIKKLRQDFAGLKKSWKNIREFFFVINDKYRGVYPEIETVLNEIKEKHKLRTCKPFLAHDLEAALFALPDDIIASVTGLIQSSSGINLQYEFGGKLHGMPAVSFMAGETPPSAMKTTIAIDQQRRYLHDKLSTFASSQLARQVLLQVSERDQKLLALIGKGNILSRLDYLHRLFADVQWKYFIRRMKKCGCVVQKGQFLDLAENIGDVLFHDQHTAKSAHESWITVLASNAHYWDLALGLCIHLAVVGDWKRLVEIAHDMILSVEENWVSTIFFSVISRINRPQIFKKLRSEDKVLLFDALGIYQIHQSKNSDALTTFTKMLTIARSSHNSWGVRQAFLHSGIAWVNLGNFQKGEQSYGKAEAEARKHRDHFFLGRVLNNLFYCFRERDTTLAERVIKESIKIKKRSRDRMGLGASYSARGILAADAKRYSESVMWFRRTERIAHRFGERYAEAQALHNQGNSLLALNRYVDAITCERRAYKIAKRLQRPDLFELVTVGLAMALYHGGQKKTALAMFLEAYEVKVTRGDISGAVTALSDAGAMALHLKDYGTAIRYFRRAIQLGFKNKDYTRLENPILNLASAWAQQGKRKRALLFIGNHVARLESMHQWNPMVALLRQMIVMLEETQSDQKKVDALWASALVAAKKSKNIRLQIDLLKERYISFRNRGDIVGAFKVLKPLIRLLSHSSEFLVEYLETLNESANEVLNLGGYGAAKTIYRRVLAVAKRIKATRLCSISLTNIGETLRRTNRPSEAIPLYHKAIRLDEMDGDGEGRLVAEHNLALALQALGKTARAEILLRKARDESGRRKDWHSHGNAWLALGDLALSEGKKYLAKNRYRKARLVGVTYGIGDLVRQAQVREPQLTTRLA